jgi:primosomal protein N' (replication factor Y)
MPTENSNAILYRIRVAIPVYVYDTFDYTVSAEQYAQAQIGARRDFF